MDKQKLIKELSVEEKLKFLVGGKSFETKGDDSLGLPALSTIDGHNGVNLMQKIMDFIPQVLGKIKDVDINPNDIMATFFEIGEVLGGITGMSKLFQDKVSEEEYLKMSDKARALTKGFIKTVPEVLPSGKLPTAFPAGLSMASTWDRELMYECGKLVATETLAYKGDVLLAPNINIHRDPHCGRMFESFSEDPYLTSELVVPYIKGVQDKGVIANVKHYVANNQETNRHTINEIISERALREIYLPGFKAAIQDANCHTVMTAYNYINGEACTANKYLLTDILRDEWKFEGLVLSDWNAVYNQVDALKAGNDLEMPGPKDQSEILRALDNGEISSQIIEKSFERYLDLVEKAPATKNIKTNDFDDIMHQEFTRKMATDSIILVKNDAVLPLEKNIKISVFGENAFNPIPCGTGSAGVVSSYVSSGYEGLKKKFEHITIKDCLADVAVVFIGEVCGEGSDRDNIKLKQEDKDLFESIKAQNADMKVIGVFNIPGPLEMKEIKEYCDAILITWYPGQEIGNAITDIISGDVNPSGKLTCSLVNRVEDLSTYPFFPGSFGTSLYGEDIFVGYRYYDIKKIEPAYCFGHGLSYSNFEYSNLEVKNNYKAKGYIDLSLNVKNISNIKGKTVVQVYVKDNKSKLIRPEKELKGFEKISLDAYEEKRVKFRLDSRSFQMYDVDKKEWLVEPGVFTIKIGDSSRNILLNEEILVECKNPYPYTLMQPLKTILSSEKVMNVINEFIPKPLLSLPELQIEQIFHPELTLDEAMTKHMFKHMNLDENEFIQLKEKIESLIKEL